MSKELEALESIKSMVLFGGEISLPYYTLNDTEYAKKVIEYKKDKLDLIENALKENKALKSQVVGLENAYDKLADKYEELKEMYEEVCKSNRVLDKKVLELNKKAKALEIIKKHGTNHTLNEMKYSTCYKDYRLLSMSNHHCVEYSKEEYDLLKEVLL